MSLPTPPVEGTAAPVRRPYVKAVGPRLKIVLIILFGLLAMIGANSAYLASITTLEWYTGRPYQDYFYQLMFLGHLALGLLLIIPFLLFGTIHLVNTRNRKNRRAVRVGYVLFFAGILVLITGLLLLRVGGFDLKLPLARSTVYWLHVVAPLIAAWLYWLHRLAGPRINWRAGGAYLAVAGAAVVVMVVLQLQDPRKWNEAGPKSGEQYFFPSLARTSTGNFIPAKTLMMDEYCAKCHQDVHAGWNDSVHHFSSFNNAAYLASVRETREVSLKRDGNVQAARFCAGCHDPVPFFSGAFDDPKFDDVRHETAHAGITCTTCHAITHLNSNRGNADYTIEEPQHYPFATSENPFLQYLNNQLIKAKPAFHKQTFLKPLHRSSEFCGSCHKVHLPEELNHYKFLRGQNHYDPFLLSGVSGHGIRSFYYPPVAQVNCNGCHMPYQKSDDFAARFFPDKPELGVHNHLFPSANTGIAWLRDRPEIIAAHQEFLKGVMRVDVFGIKAGGDIDAPLIAPLRPAVPTLQPGGKYLLETVIRTLKMGHLFTQGTADSNEIWLDVLVTMQNGAQQQIIGRSGAMNARNEVDPWSHFVNVFVLDRDGNRIDRRNAQDIFIPLYNHQIPPGAGQAVHYGLQLPDEVTGPVTVEVKLQYRKFDSIYMDYVTRSARPGDLPIRGHETGKPYLNELPVTTLATDRITFPVEGIDPADIENPVPDIPEWQRWNDYGIGLLLKGKAELRQAAEAFSAVEDLKRYDGPLNLARVYFNEGRLDEATEALQRARAYQDPAPPDWTLSWLTGMVNRQQGHLKEAEQNFRSALFDDTEARRQRKFDFSLDYEVLNALGETLFDQAKQIRDPDRKSERHALLTNAVEIFERTLKIDSENVTAHYNLQLLQTQLDHPELAEKHQQLHAKYKPDDNARDRAIYNARKKYPAANHAAESLVIYSLNRPESLEVSSQP